MLHNAHSGSLKTAGKMTRIGFQDHLAVSRISTQRTKRREMIGRATLKGARIGSSLLALLFLPLTSLFAQANDFTPQRLPDGRVGETYLVQIRAEGQTQTLIWSATPLTSLPPGVTSPLPPGIKIAPNTGLLSGTPQTAQDTPYVFVVEVRDSSASVALFKQTFSILVTSPIRGFTVSGLSVDRALKPQTNTQADCSEGEPADVGSNSDELSITVNHLFTPGTAGIDYKSQKGPITNPDALIKHTIGQCVKEWGKDDYVVVHLVKWPETDPPAQGGNAVKYEVEKEKWYLYRHTTQNDDPWELQTVQEGARIYGHRQVAVLLVHVEARESWDIKYTVNLRKKPPAPIQNVMDLAGIILGGAKALNVTGTPSLPSYWGGRLLLLSDIPSDLTVQSNITFLPSRQALAGRKADDPQPQTQQPKNYSKVYDNEGRYHWDVSAGIPVKSFKEVTYDVENQQVTAKEITRQNAYGFLNIFLNPRGVDTKGDQFYKTPHLILGVPISGKPLDRPVVGLGIGFYKPQVKFNLFAGIVFNRVREPQTLGNGMTATAAQLQSDLRTRRVRKFVFGINLPIKQFKDALSKK